MKRTIIMNINGQYLQLLLKKVDGTACDIELFGANCHDCREIKHIYKKITLILQNYMAKECHIPIYYT